MDFLTTLLQVAISPTTIAFALAAIGLNIHFGYTGLMNMGQAGFMLVGGYGFGISVAQGLGFWPALLISMLATTLFAILLGIPTLKLRGDYLAIVTISAAEIFRMIGKMAMLQNVTGGPTGLPGREFRTAFTGLSPLPDGQTTILGLTYLNNGIDDWWTRLAGGFLVILFIFITWLLIRSPWGRVLKGIREDEDAVRSLGKSAYSYKMQALIIGGIMGGFGGIFLSLPGSLHPDAMGRPTTFNLWIIVLLGGAATVFGPVLGALIFFITRILIITAANAFIPDSMLGAQQTEQFAWLLIGLALIFLVVFRPQGILGDKKELSFNV
ncbi:MAG TPA: branched-chain amino acid ABC transporter permease [Microbacteriaceae bacterium]|nr:branched-chain amino acid ABC transporter permease [Microbacteriaceae bacterium]